MHVRLAAVFIAAAGSIVPAAGAGDSSPRTGNPSPPLPAATQFIGVERAWKGPDGEVLPFSSDAEILDFLRTARVAEVTDIGEGSTRPQKVLLELNGVHMHAIFRSIERRQERTLDSGRLYAEFLDSALSEPPAYELAVLLGIPFVPPAVKRVVRNREGSVQVWIEGAMTEQRRRDNGVEPPDPARYQRLLETMNLFDNLIFNADRNPGNLVVAPDWSVWLIDHTRAFQVRNQLRTPDSITSCDRGLYERLRSLTDEALREHMAPLLDRRQLSSLLNRRRLLVEYIDRLVAERGEGAVFFDMQGG